jgi:hypothetical protein
MLVHTEAPDHADQVTVGGALIVCVPVCVA